MYSQDARLIDRILPLDKFMPAGRGLSKAPFALCVRPVDL
jgi:hypothetical protein